MRRAVPHERPAPQSVKKFLGGAGREFALADEDPSRRPLMSNAVARRMWQQASRSALVENWAGEVMQRTPAQVRPGPEQDGSTSRGNQIMGRPPCLFGSPELLGVDDATC